MIRPCHLRTPDSSTSIQARTSTMRYAAAMIAHRVFPLVLLLVACGGGDRTASWQTLSTGEAGALLAVWGTSTRDVWVVGGRGELAGAPAILHLEGESWRRVDSGQRGLDLWWVFGFDGGDVFFTGAKG